MNAILAQFVKKVAKDTSRTILSTGVGLTIFYSAQAIADKMAVRANLSKDGSIVERVPSPNTTMLSPN